LAAMMPRMRMLASLVWRRLPFPAMTVLVVALYLIKERFPFSHFPMYSRISTEADVILVTDQLDQPVAMRPVFKTSSASAKKMYKKELAAITNPLGRNSEDATAEERRQAGRLLLATLEQRLIAPAVPDGVSELRLKLQTFRVGEDPDDAEPEFLAALSIQKGAEP
jgi:hypothetical protein